MELKATQTETRPVKRLVEDFRSFSISELGRNILRRDRCTEGVFWLDDASLKPEGWYRINHKEEGMVTLDLSYPSLHGSTHQNVRLETVSVTYGNRPYLLCPSCESRRNKLQISRLGRVACRDCFNLAYQSTRDGHGNPLFRTFRRHIKLRDKQTNVRRVVYNGRYTRKAASVLRMARRLGKEKVTRFVVLPNLHDMPSIRASRPSLTNYPIQHRLDFSILFKVYILLERGMNGEFLAQDEQQVNRPLDDFFYGDWKAKIDVTNALTRLNNEKATYGCTLTLDGRGLMVSVVVDIVIFDHFIKEYLAALESRNSLARPNIAQPDQKEKAECYEVRPWSEQTAIFNLLLKKKYEATEVPITLIRFHLFGRSEEGKYHRFCFEELLIHSERKGHLSITSWNTKEDPEERNLVSLMVSVVYNAVVVFGPWKYDRINESILFGDKLLFELETASKNKGPLRQFFFLKFLIEKSGGPIETHELKRAIHQSINVVIDGDLDIAGVKRCLVRAHKQTEPFVEGRRPGSPGYRLLSEPKVIPRP